MRPSPPRQNFPKAAFSSPLNVSSALTAVNFVGSPPGIGRGFGQAGSARTTPTHSAFSQASAGQTSAGAFSAKADGQRPATRQGAIYGALEALQAAERALGEADEFTGASNLEPPQLQGGRPVGGMAALTAEEVWKSIPSGGEAAWKASQPRQPVRLRVARLQEALSEAAAGLQRASDACRGGGEDSLSADGIGVESLGPPGPMVALRNECAVLEAEAQELEEEKDFLDARVLEVKQELARVKETLQPRSSPRSPRSPLSPTLRAMLGDDDGNRGTQERKAALEAPEMKASGVGEDVSELAVVLRLLACLKDLALTNRSTILPANPARWTREQQVVAYFLDEVEACQSRDGAS